MSENSDDFPKSDLLSSALKMVVPFSLTMDGKTRLQKFFDKNYENLQTEASSRSKDGAAHMPILTHPNCLT